MINIENWSKWLLDDPVYYIKYGAFRPSESSFSHHCNALKSSNVSIWEKFPNNPVIFFESVPHQNSKQYFYFIFPVFHKREVFTSQIHFHFLCFIMCPFKYLKTQYFPVFHEREVFPSHREVVVVENDGEDR